MLYHIEFSSKLESKGKKRRVFDTIKKSIKIIRRAIESLTGLKWKLEPLALKVVDKKLKDITIEPLGPFFFCICEQ